MLSQLNKAFAITCLSITAAICTSGLTQESPAAAAEKPDASPRLGMNLNGPADWNTELPFVDVFRLSRSWISQKKDAPWGKGPEPTLDEHGWVKRLESVDSSPG